MTRLPVLALVLLVAACTSAVPGTATVAPATPGAPGVGDPYFPRDGNGGYDVADYDLQLAYEPATDLLTGTATIRARATQALSRFDLDLRGLDVREVTVDGVAASFAREGEELVVTPGSAPAQDAEFTTVVRYDGVPVTIEDFLGSSGFFHTDDGALVLGQPDVAATWFPVNDHPSDPATFTIALTVPEGLSAVANGILTAEATAGGTTTWTWRADEPMAPYLAGFGIGDFTVNAYEAGGVRFWDAFDPDLPELPVAQASLARQPEVLDFLDGDTVVVHELAHQWFGDVRPLARWSDIWLNEGFATYAEWLWDEREGRGTAQERFVAETARPAGDPFWTVRVGDPGPDGLFDEAVYVRGAMTVHALRVEIGDNAFFRLLPQWTARATQPSSTAEFVALAEEVSGRPLDDLFATWLDTPRKPL